MLKVIPTWNTKEAYKQLNELDCFFINNNLFYCLCSGTLLGCVRDKALIPWDNDLDLLVDVKEMPFIQHEIVKLGFQCEKSLKWWKDEINLEYTLHLFKNNVQVDLWPSSTTETDLITYVGKYDIKDIIPLQRVELNNFFVNIPLDPTKFLDRNYGTNWMTTIVKRLNGHNGTRHLIEKSDKIKLHI